jgi:ATP-dependent Clp protease adaptor protein ClpS
MVPLPDPRKKNMSQTETRSRTRTIEKLQEPPMFRVIYINDNQTSVEFVITSLMEIFDYTSELAEKLTVEIHEQGSGTVAVLPFEIAEQKGIEVTVSARSQNYPLQVKLEPES